MALSRVARVSFANFLQPRPGEAPRERRGLPRGDDAAQVQRPDGGAGPGDDADRATAPPRSGETVFGPPAGSHLGSTLDLTA